MRRSRACSAPSRLRPSSTLRSERVPFVLAPRGIAYLIASVLIAALLARIGSPALGIASGCIVALVILGFDFVVVRDRPEIRRATPERYALARRDRFLYTVRNASATPVRVGIVEAPVARLAFDADPAPITLAAHTSADVALGFVPRERGRTALGDTYAWFERGLGVMRFRVRVPGVNAIRVLPDLSALDSSGDLAARRRVIEAGLRKMRGRGVGTEFESLREYTTGDPFRAIDWKATARRGRTMVAQREVERSQTIIVAIDAGRLMSARLGDRRKLDYAISAALSIAAIARAAGDRVGAHVFADRPLATLAPGSGPAHAALLTELLADIEPQFIESDYERAAVAIRDAQSKRSLVVLFTDLFDPIASSTLLASMALLSKRHLVIVALMNDAAIAKALAAEPLDLADAYRAAIATNLAAERARAVTLLAARGIGVVDVPASALNLALLDAYVEVKSRARL